MTWFSVGKKIIFCQDVFRTSGKILPTLILIQTAKTSKSNTPYSLEIQRPFFNYLAVNTGIWGPTMISQVYKYADTNILVGITSHESDSKTDRQDGAEWTGTSCRAAMLWHLDSAMPHSMTGAPDWRPGVEQCDLATHSVTVSNDSQHDRCPRLATQSQWALPHSVTGAPNWLQSQWAMTHSMTGAPDWPHSYSEQCLTVWQVPPTGHTVTVSNASQHDRCPRLATHSHSEQCLTAW